MSELNVKKLYEEGIDLKRPVNKDSVPDTFDKAVDYAVEAVKGYGIGLYTKAKNYLLGLMGTGFDDPLISDRIAYQDFKYLVSRALEGDDLGLDVYEVPFERLARENAWGLWKGKRVEIPKLRDIPRMLGEVYKRLTKTYRGKALDKQVQDYIELHEKVEAVTKPANHDLYEAKLLKTLSDLAEEGNERAREVYEGALATYKVRKEKGDRFAQNVQRHFPQLERDVQAKFGHGHRKAA